QAFSISRTSRRKTESLKLAAEKRLFRQQRRSETIAGLAAVVKRRRRLIRQIRVYHLRTISGDSSGRQVIKPP
ncbi:hypothetical protein OPU71_20145, partial [Niveibacterium sp. 24ML]|uniref:hypothetical protein n=1 Tax=Niveibacterium sp. 24ML TaxID=2985512 RepID=UPI00226E9894